MTIHEFKEYVKGCKALNTDDIHLFMHNMSDEARRITFELNTAYRSQEEIRELLSSLFGYQVPSTLRVFPPFYTDFIYPHGSRNDNYGIASQDPCGVL